MTERSGIDMLKELLSEVKRLDQRLDIMEITLKKIANSAKIGELASKAVQPPKSKQVEAFDPSKLKKPPKPPPQPKCMCTGRMTVLDKGKQLPVTKASVQIFDANDNLVKKTKTNMAGHWMSQLPPGKYVALLEGEYNGKDLYPTNINFEVKPGMKTMEINNG